MKSAWIIVGVLLAGLVLGLGIDSVNADLAMRLMAFVQPIGQLWLNALQMTIVPLVVALLITGITATADAARAGRLAARSVGTFLVCIWSSAILAAILMPLILATFPLAPGAMAALKSGMGTAEATGPVPGFAEFILSLVPTNPVAAAAETAILPLIIFTAIFAFAITRLPDEPRQLLTGFFSAVADAMLVVIGWVLALAPIGVFALAFTLAIKAGAAAFGGLVHYVVTVSSIGVIVLIAAYLFAWLVARVPLMTFARTIIPAQAVAISTQSSLASLPAMLRASVALGVDPKKADVTLPLAVALFRVTGPAMNLAVAIYVAWLFGIELTPWTLAAGVAVAATTTLGAVSLPGSISFVTSIAPIAVAMGVPIAPLALLVAVETLPDIFRTLSNVTMDIAVTKAVANATTDEGELP